MSRTRGGSLAAAVAAVPLLLGGCGIQETDPIEAGGPATVEAFYNRDDDIMLFFRTPDGGLNPVLRTVRPSAGFGGDYVESDPGTTPGPPSTEKTVLALLAGPREVDRAAGLTTALPPVRPGSTVTVKTTPGGTVTTGLPFPLKALSTTARRQLTCTIAYSQAADGKAVVKLTGQDGASSSATCGLAP
ncbi:hypothetical protein SJX93_16800 [Streptomyces cyaneofuscatus]|uniref:hypothetical protein n=1 Tax=Streptomyces cyaneofuscatus TaxID=66883 RepID=UPI002D765ECA|nr:hypothetical protein [Streptomyces cyaneofuscatus]WRO11164.1 hypothetical protein SJX93_16800 [Streptomyces cyaneofuscatus]